MHARRKDGSELPVEIGLGFVREDPDLLAIATVSDASFRLAAEAEMMRALDIIDTAIGAVETAIGAVEHNEKRGTNGKRGASA